MWISKGWKDYELIDCSDGERLERWDKYILIRPDPQVIWNTPKDNPLWRKADAKYIRSSSGGGHWEKKNMPEQWSIGYSGIRLGVKPMNFKHTGVFPEQAANWDFMSSLIKKADRNISVLNLFAYTGGATLACAAAGASVCHVDAARGMVAQARKNAELSGLSDRPVRWIIDDCAGFVKKEIKRGRKYDAVVMDPPSYGRGPSGEIWRIEDSLFPLLKLTVELLSEKPLFFIINSYTTGLSPSVLKYILMESAGKKYGGEAEADELGLEVSSSGLSLPCGAAGRWMRTINHYLD